MSDKIEFEYEFNRIRNNEKAFECKINNHEYTIQFDPRNEGKGYQLNKLTKKSREIKRTIYKKGKILIKQYSSNIEKEFIFKPLNKMMNFPSSWSNIDKLSFQTSIYSVVELEETCQLWNSINKIFKATMPLYKITRIERVQNLVAYQKYHKE